MKDTVLYAVQVGERFVRVRSYGEFTLVDHPAQGTLFNRERDARVRCAKVQRWGLLLRQTAAHSARRSDALLARVVTLRLSYEVV